MNITDLIGWIGKTIPGDKYEWLVCGKHDFKHGRWPWEYERWEDEGINPLFPEACPTCGHELHVHMPRKERWQLNYMFYRNRVFPHRIYQPAQTGIPQGTKWWEWRRRKFLVRPYHGMDWMLDYEEEVSERG